MKKTSHNHFEQFTVEEESRAFLSGLKTAAYGIDRDAVYRKACQKAGIQPKKRWRVWQKWAFLAACALLVAFTGVGVFSAFPAAQHKLAQFLHLSPEGTQYIGITSSSNGYTMKVVSGRLCKDNAVVLVTFEKDDGTAFQGNWSPDFSLFLDDGSQMPFSGFSDGLYSELSQDQKTLSCYYTWRFPSSEAGRSVTLKADKLICSDSQAGYAPIPEPIAGNWTASFSLMEIPGSTITLENPDPSSAITAFYQKMQIDSVTLSDTLAVISTTTLEKQEITEEDRQRAMLSSISPDSSAFFGLQLQLVYRDGTTSEPVSFMENGEGDFIAWFYDPIPLQEVAAVRIGDLIIPNPAG